MSMILKLIEGGEGWVEQLERFKKLMMFSTSSLNCIVLQTNPENLCYIFKLIS